tara:strand:+ start:11902 stop:12393 length:492 start_codon:yes stop_codon:yes gene_type:complete
VDKTEPEKQSYSWDKEFFEKKITFFTNLQLGSVGAALMLMMMNLSKLYLLAPLVIVLILASWYKHHITKVSDEVKNSSVTFSPKSVLVTIPNQEIESRVTFRQIDEIGIHKENFIETVTLYLKEDEDKIELKAIKNAKQFVSELNQAAFNTTGNTTGNTTEQS